MRLRSILVAICLAAAAGPAPAQVPHSVVRCTSGCDVPPPPRQETAEERARREQREEEARQEREERARRAKEELDRQLRQQAEELRQKNDELAARLKTSGGGLSLKSRAGAGTVHVGAEIRGEVFIVGLDGRKRRVDRSGGIQLQMGARLVTGGGSRLQILLPDQTTFTVGADSDVVFDEFVYDPASRPSKVVARLVKGIFRFVTGNVRPSDLHLLQIKGNAFAIGIRGTDFECGVLPAGSGSLKLYAGAIDFTPRNGVTVAVQAGQMIEFDERGKVTGPLPLPR